MKTALIVGGAVALGAGAFLLLRQPAAARALAPSATSTVPLPPVIPTVGGSAVMTQGELSILLKSLGITNEAQGRAYVAERGIVVTSAAVAVRKAVPR